MSFIPIKQKKLFKPEFEGTAIELIERLLVENPQYSVGERKKGFTNLYFGDFAYDKDNRMILLKLGKQKEWKRSDYREAKFIDEIKEDYPHVLLLWDRNEQTILIERNTAIFPNYLTVFKSIENHFNNLLEKFELEVYIVPIPKKGDFWKIIKEYQLIYEISFELYQPNLFGETEKSVKEILECFNEEYNATSVTITIANPRGNLKVADINQRIIDDINWVDKGGGTWKLKCRKSQTAKKETITSRDHIVITEVTDEVTESIMENPDQVISAVKKEKTLVENKENLNAKR